MTTVSRRLQKTPDTRSDASLFIRLPLNLLREVLWVFRRALQTSRQTLSPPCWQEQCGIPATEWKSIFHTDAHLHSERDRLETRGLGQGKKEGEKTKQGTNKIRFWRRSTLRTRTSTLDVRLLHFVRAGSLGRYMHAQEGDTNFCPCTRKRLVDTRVALLKRALADC